MIEIICTNCRRPYPESGAPYRCPSCGGIFDYSSFPGFSPAQVDGGLPGIWRYRHVLGLPQAALSISLGEGGTPLVWKKAFKRKIAFKQEYLNPTGSFKDRGSATLVSFLAARGVDAVIEDSFGNAGASLAAYAAQAGIKSQIILSEAAPAALREIIEAYGAQVDQIPGTPSMIADYSRKTAEQGVVYASHAYSPLVLTGYATIAYELMEQMKKPPGTVVAPVGQGNLLLAVGRGFEALKGTGIILRVPALIGVQAMTCAPLWAVYKYGAAGLGWVTERETLAEHVRIKHPMRGDAVLASVEDSGGVFVAVDEDDILPGRDSLAKLGFNVEPSSAIVWDALTQIVGHCPEPIVVILTGAAIKNPSIP